MKLYIVRHGQTEANVNRLFNGRNQRDLTDFGVKQAKILACQMKNLNIDLIFCSPLKRTIHTANILNVDDLEIITDDRLIERDFGSFTLKSIDLIKDKSVLYNLKENVIKEVESYKSIYNRVSNFIEELKKNYYDKNILVVTHGDIVVAFQEYLNQKSNEYPKICTLIKYDL